MGTGVAMGTGVGVGIGVVGEGVAGVTTLGSGSFCWKKREIEREKKKLQ